MPEGRTVFVLLPGRREEQDHYQLLQEETALASGRRHGLRIEIAWAAPVEQVRVLMKRLLQPAVIDAVVFEPSNVATVELLLRDLRERTGLVLLNTWSPSVEQAARTWSPRLPFGTVSTDHLAIGRIQGEQVRSLVSGGTILCVTGPRRASAVHERLQSFRATVGGSAEILDTEAADWSEAAGGAAFLDWYRFFKSRDPRLSAVAAQGDELAIGVKRAIAALADAGHRARLSAASILGVDACPGYGRRLVDEGRLAASVVNPANTGLALDRLHEFWTAGRPLPVRSFTAPSPYPPAR
jgi:ABC-type sugar transport system substrate-binding protein